MERHVCCPAIIEPTIEPMIEPTSLGGCVTRGIMGLMAVAAGMSVAACSADQESLPAAPEFHRVTSRNSGCDFSHIKNLVNKSFTNSTQRQFVGGLVNQMKAAGKYTAVAQDRGFVIFVELSKGIHLEAVGTEAVGPAATLSDLVNECILCMFDPNTRAGAYPSTFPENFTVAVNPSARGAFEVPDGSKSDPVFSRPLSAPFSGMAPEGASWSTTVGGGRVLIYGQPGSGPQIFDWRAVPNDVVFEPEVIVGVCVDPFANPTALLHRQNVRLLPFRDATFINLSSCSSLALLDEGWGPLELARGLARWGTWLLSPRPLWAASMNPGGLGGSTGGRSEFGPQEVSNVDLAFVVQPSDVAVGQIIAPAVQMKATAVGTTTTVAGVAITIAALNNNGTPGHLCSAAVSPPTNPCTTDTVTRTTDASGVATFDDLYLTKPGAVKLQTTIAEVVDRPAISVGSATSV
ncbi:MAG: hypothetical protein ACRD08_01245, partial [Acidimicrobiales bacterium]